MKRVGIIGMGAIGARIASTLVRCQIGEMRLASVCVREYQKKRFSYLESNDVQVFTDLEAMLELETDIYIEAASHKVVAEWGEKILNTNSDLYVLSVGALAETDVLERLIVAATQANSRIRIPAGALGGFDALLTLQRSGLRSVKYTAVKPPRAWTNTPAEEEHNLEEITCRTSLFQGNARCAAKLYSKNANLSAAVALAGLGMSSTKVELIADPDSDENVGLLDAIGRHGSLHIEISGEAAADNPKTSAIVADSVIASLANQGSAIQFG